MNTQNKQKVFIISLQLATVALLIVGASITNQSLKVLYSSYFADIMIPFSFYFLLFLIESNHRWLKKWWVKLILVFSICTVSETLQYFGIFALARVFDPLDYVAYALGALLAAFTDRQIFAKLLPFWE